MTTLGVLASTIMALNLGVAVCGETLVNPFSPFFLRQKATALSLYARHRAGCLGKGHPPLETLLPAAARRHRVDPALLAALVEVESGSRPHRISRTGAMGPAQMMPATAQGLGLEDPYDPAQALEAGARHLRQLLDRYGGNTALALAAYNAGPGAVTGGRVPRNGETEHYVPRVLELWRREQANGR